MIPICRCHIIFPLFLDMSKRDPYFTFCFRFATWEFHTFGVELSKYILWVSKNIHYEVKIIKYILFYVCFVSDESVATLWKFRKGQLVAWSVRNYCIVHHFYFCINNNFLLSGLTKVFSRTELPLPRAILRKLTSKEHEQR